MMSFSQSLPSFSSVSSPFSSNNQSLTLPKSIAAAGPDGVYGGDLFLVIFLAMDD
jgi:hypothetical protein